MLKIAVIGTAGRGEDFNMLQPSSFDKMCDTVYGIINSITKQPYLVSGGAAWADHVAVRLFNSKLVEHLDLHLPKEWDYEHEQFKESWRNINDPGRISNYYHRQFSIKTGINSLKELDLALKHCRHTVNNGFFKRNDDVAKAQAVIALTFGNGSILKDGGTAYTFGKYLKRNNDNISFHVDLHDWKIYNPATL